MHKAKRSLLPSYYKAYKHLLNFRCCISNESGSHFGHLAPDGLLDLFQNNNWPGKDSKKKMGENGSRENIKSNSISDFYQRGLIFRFQHFFRMP